MHYKPAGTSLDVGFYFMNYHDKMPVLALLADGTGAVEFPREPQDVRHQHELPVGELGGRLGAFLPAEGCRRAHLSATVPGVRWIPSATASSGVTTPLWIDKEKYQMHLTGLLSLTPGDHGWFLDLLKADTATFAGEVVFTHYTGVSPGSRYNRTFDNQP